MSLVILTIDHRGLEYADAVDNWFRMHKPIDFSRTLNLLSDHDAHLLATTPEILADAAYIVILRGDNRHALLKPYYRSFSHIEELSHGSPLY